ncbi:hypothetical protein [Paenibacillus caui]|uniref:hypothetical protein n=1 Tax=Paenibacillus caui TaxID=2873927 RepID=UPI001CA9E43F|nr:hypothetical protein [Paenibacillus caui]
MKNIDNFASKEELEVVSTVQKYFNAEKNHDLTTMLDVSTDSLYPDKETKAHYLGESAKQIISFEVSDVQKISGSEYTANIDVTYDDNEDYPKYPIHIIKDAGTWKLNLELVAFFKDSNGNWNYEIVNSSPIQSINTITAASTVAVGDWTSGISAGSSTYVGPEFTYNALYNLTISGWQQPVSDYSEEPYIEYDLMLKTGSTSYSQESALSYYGTVYQSGEWFSMQFNNTSAGSTYRVLVKNIGSISSKGAFNIYN